MVILLLCFASIRRKVLLRAIAWLLIGQTLLGSCSRIQCWGAFPACSCPNSRLQGLTTVPPAGNFHFRSFHGPRRAPDSTGAWRSARAPGYPAPLRPPVPLKPGQELAACRNELHVPGEFTLRGPPRIAVAFPHTRFAHKRLCPGVLGESPMQHCPPASTEEGEDRTGSPAHSARSRIRRASSHDSLCDAHGAPVRTPHLGSTWAPSQPPSPSLLCHTHPFLWNVTTDLLISFLVSKLGRSSSV